MAKYCGGGIYIENKFPNKNFENLNEFKNNSASFGNDICTFPNRIRYINDEFNYDSLKNQSIFELEMTPNIDSKSFHFEIMDYFGQTMNQINERLTKFSLFANIF